MTRLPKETGKTDYHYSWRMYWRKAEGIDGFRWNCVLCSKANIREHCCLPSAFFLLLIDSRKATSEKEKKYNNSISVKSFKILPTCFSFVVSSWFYYSIDPFPSNPVSSIFFNLNFPFVFLPFIQPFVIHRFPNKIYLFCYIEPAFFKHFFLWNPIFYAQKYKQKTN